MLQEQGPCAARPCALEGDKKLSTSRSSNWILVLASRIAMLMQYRLASGSPTISANEDSTSERRSLDGALGERRPVGSLSHAALPRLITCAQRMSRHKLVDCHSAPVHLLARSETLVLPTVN